MSTQSVVEHHLQALADGDLEAVMADYTAASVFLSNDTKLEGDEIRGMFARAVANGGFAVELQNAAYHGPMGYITWSVPGVIDLGTDTFIVENDKIVLQTAAMAMAPR